MTTETKQINSPHMELKHGVAAQAGYFFRHLMEMLLAVMVGMVILGFVALRLAGTMGYTDPLRQIPEVSGLVMAFNMAIPMSIWMRYRGIGIVWLGLCPKSSLILWQHVLMVPAMIVPMLYRRDLYTGHVSHHAHTH